MKHFFALLMLHAALAATAPADPLPAQTSKAATTRIAIVEGRFVEKGTGKPFRPLGVNYYRWTHLEKDKQGHSAISPGSYDETYVTRMMDNLSRDGFNTVRTFLTNHNGPNGIVESLDSPDISPAFLKNLIHFLRLAGERGIHIILTWDMWPPDCRPWKETPLTDEASYGWLVPSTMNLKTNSFRLSPRPIRSKANAIRALIIALQKAAPELLPVVLAWELENEVHFAFDQEPFLSRPTSFEFGGSQFDLSTDSGAQALMDTAVRHWANACADAIHQADPSALVSTSVFTFAAVGRQGPGTWSKDTTKNPRVPARPLALLDTKLDFIDIHLYAGRSQTGTIAQHLEHDLASVEMTQLTEQARRLGKPILVGESGIPANYTRRPPEWQTIHHDVGVGLLGEFHRALAAKPFAGVLHWHYGSPDSTAKDEFPAMQLFPQYGEVLKSAWKNP